jgi:hypothetical protein
MTSNKETDGIQNMKQNLQKMTAIALALGAAGAVLAQTKDEPGKISGTVFGDVYYVSGHHDSAVEGMNGFWFRRIYLTYDRWIDDKTSLRLRQEASSAGDFSSKSKMTPFMKDAYLKFKEDGNTYTVGLHGTPTWGTVEKALGYRPIEKTPLDLWKLGSSRDHGISVKGKLDPSGATKYNFMIGNGSSTSTEIDAGKTYYLSLDHKVSKNVSVMGYIDHWDKPGHKDRRTAQAFLAYKNDDFTAGLLWADQKRQLDGGGDYTMGLWSLYADVAVSEKSKLFARVDKLNAPSPDGPKISYMQLSDAARPTLYMIGLDTEVRKNVRFVPNITLVTYDGSSVPDSVFIKLTFAVKF